MMGVYFRPQTETSVSQGGRRCVYFAHTHLTQNENKGSVRHVKLRAHEWRERKREEGIIQESL